MFAWWRQIIIDDDGAGGGFYEPDVVPLRTSGPGRILLRSGANRIKKTRRVL
jgi:hypothetical protein